MFLFDVQSDLNETLSRKENAVLAAIEAALNAQLLEEQEVIVDEKLSGGVLQRKTGEIASSVHATPIQFIEGVITGEIQAGSGDAFYGFFQEHGTDRVYDILPVNKKALAFIPGVSGAQQGLFGNEFKPSLAAVIVRKVIHPPIQQRSFMASTHEERRATFAQAIEQAILGALA